MDTVQWIISAGANALEAVQLSEHLSRLRSSLPKARLLMDRADWGRFTNKDLQLLVSQLKDAAHHAEDLLWEHDGEALRHKMENAGRSHAGQVLSSSVNLVRTLVHGSKRRVLEAQSKLDELVAKVEEFVAVLGLTVEPLQLGRSLMPETSSIISEPLVVGRDEERDQVLEFLGVPLDDRGSARSDGKRAASTACIATSSSKRLKGVCGSAQLAGYHPGNVSVLPIVGIGGMGKTTLAQIVYNDPRVKAHFDARIWVSVSEHFDLKRVIMEIIRGTCAEVPDTQGSLEALHTQLTRQLETRKFLLVLDNMWPSANQEWQAVLAPLRCGLEGSMILVTTRFPKVAEVVAATTDPLHLEGLPPSTFWDFFKMCAFGTASVESYPQLQVIGQKIASRLCGSPLAAKTLGSLLKMELTERHWLGILNSRMWELPHEDNGILRALQLSYLYLPLHLKRCFAFCSIFPKNYRFLRDELVDMWVAVGFVETEGNTRLEDLGVRYFNDLRSRFLFHVYNEHQNPNRFVMHELIHDMAQSVSVDECFLMQDHKKTPQLFKPQSDVESFLCRIESDIEKSNEKLQLFHRTSSCPASGKVSSSYQKPREIPHTIRHITFEVVEFPSGIMDTRHLTRLHSLRCEGVEESWLSQLSNIRLLSLRGCPLENLPESICMLNHLRYLDISESSIKKLPEKFWRLYGLQVLDALGSSLETIHKDVTKLINLRNLELPTECILELSELGGLGNLSSLRKLCCFTVGRENGRRISELKNMNLLSGTLHIKDIDNVRTREEAAEARLVDKQYLQRLFLMWGVGSPRNSSDNSVIEGLHPPSGIEELEVHGFGGDIFSSWYLPSLRELKLFDCLFLRNLSIDSNSLPSLKKLELIRVGIEVLLTSTDNGVTNHRMLLASSSTCSTGRVHLPLTDLTTLHLFSCCELKNIDQFLSPEHLPSIKSIEIVSCTHLLSLPVHSFAGFGCLENLKIHGCEDLMCPREMVLPPSLQTLSIGCCGQLDMSFPGCLANLKSLIYLNLDRCRNVKVIPLNSVYTNKLKVLFVCDCSELSSVGGPQALTSIQCVAISGCSKLSEVRQPFHYPGLEFRLRADGGQFVGLGDGVNAVPVPCRRQRRRMR